MDILRHSMNLLRPKKLQSMAEPFWFDQAKVARMPEIGLPVYKLNVCDQLNFIEPVKSDDDMKPPKTRHLFNHMASKLFSQLESPWFEQFSTRVLLASYPVDRFTLLVAVWLVGHQCGHHQLESLMSELVDAVHHQEANSCNEEQLLQLDQIGSVWVTYRRRYCAMQFSNSSLASATSNSEWTEQGENGYDNNSNSSSSNDDDDDSDSFKGRSSSSISAGLDKPSVAKLRRQIDIELGLSGNNDKCLLCGHERGQQLSGGGLGKALEIQRCQKCHYDRWQECCAISQKSLQLASVNSVLSSKQTLSSLMLVQPAEWLRHLVKIRQPMSSIISDNQSTNDNNRRAASERIDISENFQRLTLIRSDDEEDESKDDGSGSIGSDQSDGSISSSKPDLATTINYKQVLTNFMASRVMHPRRLISAKTGNASESLQMLRHTIADRDHELTTATTLVVNALDLLLSDQIQLDKRQSEPVELCLRLSRAGRIWACASRSEFVQLPLGCGRKFDSLELVKLTGVKLDAPSSKPVCPFCGSLLSEITSVSR